MFKTAHVSRGCILLWGYLLKTTYNDSIKVVNRGRSGFNTDMTINTVLPVVTSDLQAASPIVITLWLGANDAALATGTASHQHVSIDAYKANLITIITALRLQARSAHILLISPPPVDEVKHLAYHNPVERTIEQVGKYATAGRDVAKSHAASGVSFLDMFGYFMETYPDTNERASFLSDGLHFNDKGNKEVFEQIKKQIQILRPSVLVEPSRA